jgi:hypothetical protein
MKLSDVKDEQIPWVWPVRIARGLFTILEGDPGIGKGIVIVDLLARITRGWPMPDEELAASENRGKEVRPLKPLNPQTVSSSFLTFTFHFSLCILHFAFPSPHTPTHPNHANSANSANLLGHQLLMTVNNYSTPPHPWPSNTCPQTPERPNSSNSTLNTQYGRERFPALLV